MSEQSVLEAVYHTLDGERWKRTADVFDLISPRFPDLWWDDVATLLKALVLDGRAECTPPLHGGRGLRYWRRALDADGGVTEGQRV